MKTDLFNSNSLAKTCGICMLAAIGLFGVSGVAMAEGNGHGKTNIKVDASAEAFAGAHATNNLTVEGGFALAGIGGGSGMCPTEGFTIGAPGIGGIGYNKTGNACLDWEIAQVLWKAGLISDNDFVDAALAISQTQERAPTATTTTSTMSAPATSPRLQVRPANMNQDGTVTQVMYRTCDLDKGANVLHFEAKWWADKQAALAQCRAAVAVGS